MHRSFAVLGSALFITALAVGCESSQSQQRHYHIAPGSMSYAPTPAMQQGSLPQSAFQYNPAGATSMPQGSMGYSSGQPTSGGAGTAPTYGGGTGSYPTQGQTGPYNQYDQGGQYGQPGQYGGQ